MGKSLVIKGADFSENGISALIGWCGGYPDSILQGENGKVVSTNNMSALIASEVTRLGMVGKTIKYIKLDAANTGTLKVYTTDTSDNTPSGEQVFSVAQGKNIVELTTPISITSNAVGIGVVGNGVIRYWSSSKAYQQRGWLYAENGAARIPVDFGYEL